MQKYQMVKFDFENLPATYHSQYPFTSKDRFIMLGEIEQMQGHCIVVRTKDNVVFTCYHTDNFIPLKEEEM